MHKMIKLVPESRESRILLIGVISGVMGLLLFAGLIFTLNKKFTNKPMAVTKNVENTLSPNQEGVKNAQAAASAPASASSAPTHPAKPLVDANTLSTAALATFSAYPPDSKPTQVAQEWFAHGSRVVDPSNVSIVIRVKNTGGDAGAPTCTVKVQNSDGSNTGTAVVKHENISANVTVDLLTNVVVSNHGASSITEINTTCL